ncbi:MAG TPA: 2-succinyl-5-enolpyruvyl-6-hydroxy-3-cyclohexene-1-carboxylic-acid synthase [Acidimicrobiales bacterium]|nr:2-succinyl-5-enolpyruvyl-6-hydroxy-3-cyclohexene-1-carboxylic-acid synthase [Acidimicrobiales bacterium]
MSVPSTGERQAAYAATLVDEWTRGGVTDAVVCPGSRSTPLALALARAPGITVHVRLDERGAGFFALGVAMMTGRPPVVCTTSGTAAAELHPSVVEADLAGVPVLVCTADRPPDLHEVGAPQTLRQTALFGTAVRWFFEPGPVDGFPEGAWRSLGARALAEAASGPRGPGPVHLNLAFVDPLTADPGPLPPGRPDGRRWHDVVAPIASPGGRAGELVRRWRGRRGLLVAGGGCGPPPAVAALADALAWPLVADPRSGCRSRRGPVVAAADAFLRDPEVRSALRPDAVLLIGAPPASKALAGYLAEAGHAGAEVVAVDPWWRWRDPERLVGETHVADPGAWVAEALAEASPGLHEAPGVWLGLWERAERAAQEAIDEVLDAEAGGVPSEPALSRRLLGALPAGTTLVVSSSMPVRDLEWYAPPMEVPPIVLANRGANGIDGVSATAQGVAAAADGPVVGLLGDLAFLHDASSLVRPAGPGLGRCTLVVVDNGGGGIFSFLPQATALDGVRFEQLFGTPQAPDVAAVATGFGLPVVEPVSLDDLAEALAHTVGHHPLAVVRVRVRGRADNVALHDRIHAAVAEAVAPLSH